jgi:hypothetical protein
MGGSGWGELGPPFKGVYMGSEDSQIRADLFMVGNDRSKLMQQYSEQLQEMLKPYGGNFGDAPMDAEHPIHKLRAKIQRLNTLE